MEVASRRARVLCVDDDPVILDELGAALARRFDVLAASSGREALELLAQRGDVAVVLADLRMPGMDGLSLLREVRRVAPLATRVLLSDRADPGALLDAINEAEVFRVVGKPASLAALATAVDAAVLRHRHLRGERERFSTGLRDGLGVLVEVLASASPVAFGRALRLRDTALRVAVQLGGGDLWALELAALLSSIGYCALPRELLGKLERDEPLSLDEQAQLDCSPQVAERLLERVPGLEVVRSILATAAAGSGEPRSEEGPPLDPMLQRAAIHGGHILGLAADFDALEQRHGSRTALEVVRAGGERYDARAVEALCAVFGVGPLAGDARSGDAPLGAGLDEAGGVLREMVREVAPGEVALGMVIVDEVRTREGSLLARRGQPVTPALLERLRNARPGTLREPLRVALGAPGAPVVRLP